MKPDRDSTLHEARAWLLKEVDDGVPCPLCAQYVKLYRRPLPLATARTMIEIYRAGAADDFVFLPPILDRMTGTPHQGGYNVLGQHWALMEGMDAERDDGSRRVGYWRLTALGVRFVEHAATVPKYAHLYNGRCLRLSGEPVSITDALGHRFDYRELMEGTA